MFENMIKAPKSFEAALVKLAESEIKEMCAIEARRLERDRIMELFEAIKADVYRHVPSGSDSVAVQEIFLRFEASVASA